MQFSVVALLLGVAAAAPAVESAELSTGNGSGHQGGGHNCMTVRYSGEPLNETALAFAAAKLGPLITIDAVQRCDFSDGKLIIVDLSLGPGKKHGKPSLDVNVLNH
ncbi:hypothetical protein VFPPC_13565 [Pochonia chlamydosporia 170]|uniref:Uncharacterized protein n=1 Tax=Pochonia chlamydosporia 170 TaxID=1380566 RepID=A0A179FQ28_METCM|nr:hypothetical protein VFPPC_13565 [Pochonia chlamydosporia 170]OAQ67692.1 hypothetical protein VFPPC_13565 [Pochonia chlamydosporia 170]